jgi:hypothetical protein
MQMQRRRRDTGAECGRQAGSASAASKEAALVGRAEAQQQAQAASLVGSLVIPRAGGALVDA